MREAIISGRPVPTRITICVKFGVREGADQRISAPVVGGNEPEADEVSNVTANRNAYWSEDILPKPC